MKKLIIIHLICALVAGCSNGRNEQSATKIADRVFIGDYIYTVDENRPWAQALAIKDDKIIYVGDRQSVTDYIGESTQVDTLGKQMLLPGFIDSHAHPVMGGAYIRSLALDTFATPEHWYQQIADYAKQHDNDEILFGFGFLASAFGPQGPDKRRLDEIVADKPVFIFDEGFHGAWVNSKALELLAVNANTPDPVPGFSYYKRDENHQPTGYLLEGTATDAVSRLGILTRDRVAAGTADVISVMNQFGITSVFDAGALDVDRVQLDVLELLAQNQQLTVRYVGSHMIKSQQGFADGVKQAIEKRRIASGDGYQINMLKIMNDGTIEGKTAAMHTDYQQEVGNRGETVFDEQQMTQILSQATAADMDVHIHALGERAISEALNAIEAVKRDYPSHSNRFTLCHIQVMTDADVQRFAELGVIAQSTPLWASYDEYGKAFVNDDQFQRYFRFNSLNEAGVTLSFGSDFPASGAGILGMSPVFNMEIGHTRQNPGEPQAPIQPGENERLDIASLIEGYTLGAAHQLRMESQIGSLEVGKMADLVILQNNLFDVEPYDIHQVEVVETILAGKAVYVSDEAFVE
ncbi:amidohydrolase [Thalassotalea mangrovi]|uniref:Amidohydrolase n=1 Tax=Thalassotalea mangrovi TaxID=2572245 RepID=A0A4U1B8C2_9GAMM|nr:amidohydrolase [Thalassotalea mangrovi]TKB46736.1 amidohydrolase [Thalassotalea mangrovi]